MPYAVNLTIPSDVVRDLLISAMEGGSNYWARFLESVLKRPRTDGAYVLLEEMEDGGEVPVQHKINSTRMEDGLHIMAKKYPRHFGNLISDNWDAETADVFLQCCVFGEVKYG